LKSLKALIPFIASGALSVGSVESVESV
jgi:hypothetical protein